MTRIVRNVRVRHVAVNDNQRPRVSLQKQFASLKEEKTYSPFRFYHIKVRVIYRMTLGRVITCVSPNWRFEEGLSKLADAEGWLDREPEEYTFTLLRPERPLSRTKAENFVFDLSTDFFEPLTNRDVASLGACFPSLPLVLGVLGRLEVATVGNEKGLALHWGEGRCHPCIDSGEDFGPKRLLALANMRRD